MSRKAPIRLEMPRPKGLWEHIEAFWTAVDFTEPAIAAILVGHAVLLLLAIRARESSWGHTLLFAYLISSCFLLSSLNDYLRTHWASFFSQNYFDESGLFLCLLVGFPYLLICFFLLVFGIQMCSLVRNYRLLRSMGKVKTS